MADELTAARQAEHAKYERAYGMNPKYRMKRDRLTWSRAALSVLPCRGAYLDVSCGQGDMLDGAARLGFAPVQGTEIVPALIDGKRVIRAEVHDLPFGDRSFDVATMFDVIEHLLPGDDELACRELGRVARRHVLISANNKDSFNKVGEQLHVNKRPYEEWHGLLCDWFPCAEVTRLPWPADKSQCWRIDLA